MTTNVMNDFWDRVLDFCVQTTATISDRLMQDFGKIQANAKEDGSLVTQADRWSDGQIREAMRKSEQGMPDLQSKRN